MKQSAEAPKPTISSLPQQLLKGLEAALIPLTVIAALIFVLVGASRPLWLDEADSIQFATQTFGGILERLSNDINLPAYYLILHQWIVFFGDSESSARSLSGCMYLASIGIVFLIGRCLFNDRRSALYSGFFYLISMQAIRNAQNIRSYALLGFLASLSILFCIRLLRLPGSKTRDCIALVLVNAVGCFTHVWFFFLLMGEFLGCLIYARRKWLGGVTLGALSVFPFASLWAAAFLSQLGNGASASLNSFMPPFYWAFLPDVFLEYYGGVIPGLYFFLIVCALLVRPARERSFSAFLREPSVGILAVLFGGSILVAMSICLFKPIYLPNRYTIIALPALATLLGTILARFANRALLVAFCYGLVLWTSATHLQARHVNESSGIPLPVGQSDRDTARYIGQHAKTGDVLVFTSLSRLAVDYYLKRNACGNCLREISFPSELDGHPSWRNVPEMLKNRSVLEAEAERDIESWKQLAARDQASIWVIYGRDLEVSDILKKQLDRHFSLVQQLEMQGPFHTFLLKYTDRPDSEAR